MSGGFDGAHNGPHSINACFIVGEMDLETFCYSLGPLDSVNRKEFPDILWYI